MLKKFDLQSSPFIIAEVGQNHQGSLDVAREYIRMFADTGAHAIKFQTRNNAYLFSESAYNKAYESENAFGESYGAHREALELKPEWLPILRDDCHAHGMRFMSTPFDEPSLELLCDVGVDVLKVSSFDLGNLPLISKIASKGIPVVISVGGGNVEQIRSSVETILQVNDDLAILHCVSEYPCDVERLGLENIRVLEKEFPDCTIGLSDHFNGILSGPVAYMLGARVFEKHVTLNRAWKGTDHSFALEHHGFKNFVRDIVRVPLMMPPKPANELGSEPVFKKLGKSLVAARDIEQGEALSLENLSGRIFQSQHLPVRESGKLIGRKAAKKILAGQLITLDVVE